MELAVNIETAVVGTLEAEEAVDTLVPTVAVVDTGTEDTAVTDTTVESTRHYRGTNRTRLPRTTQRQLVCEECSNKRTPTAANIKVSFPLLGFPLIFFFLSLLHL